MAEYYDREKLYKEVWESPMIEFCKIYGVSDVALSKTCKKLKVPKPPVGYWAKKAAGKAPTKPKMYPYENAPKLLIRSTPTPNDKEPEPRLVPEAFAEAETLFQKLDTVSVCDDLENLHAYVHNTRKVFKRKIKKGWSDDYNRISVSGEDVFAVSIGADSLDRATIILQSLCSTMEELGFGIVQSKYGSSFHIMDEDITMKISESSKKQPITMKDPKKYYYKDYEYITTRVLKIEIYTGSFSMDERKSWTDGKSKIEDRLESVIHQIIRAAAWKKEYVAYHKKREEEWQRRQKEQAEKDRLARIEKQRISQLEDGYKKWRYHKELSEYVNAIKSHYSIHKGEPEGDFAKWVEWVDAYLEKSNPFKGEYPNYDVPEHSWR
ncbi:hypothetical protein [Spirochaeta isovalerica]|uniref:Uncharacterized protein n=1 Tax=Spirochaeta isovalerica TaxID=150 RepID=A0A841RG79_9SPIO|nr:hypothetical protein [Spirochaeta isovalerica]MBB6481538.1 hypothetical protein [Spirochaeta isovalerica]